MALMRSKIYRLGMDYTEKTYEIISKSKVIIKKHGLKGADNRHSITMKRTAIIYLLRLANLTYFDIGKLLKRDHTTAIYHYKNAVNMLEYKSPLNYRFYEALKEYSDVLGFDIDIPTVSEGKKVYVKPALSTNDKLDKIAEVEKYYLTKYKATNIKQEDEIFMQFVRHVKGLGHGYFKLLTLKYGINYNTLTSQDRSYQRVNRLNYL